MTRRILLPLALLAAWSIPAFAQTPDANDGITALLTRLESALQTGDKTILAAALLSPPADDVRSQDFADTFFVPGVNRAVARERDRRALEGAVPGDGFSIVADFFSEAGDSARIFTARLDLRRPRGGDAASWRIADLERLSLVEGLYRLRLDVAHPFAAHQFVVTSEDLSLTLEDGAVYEVRSDEGVTGLVMIGRGTMRFSPTPVTEKGQLRIFAGAEVLSAPFETAYVRLNPQDYISHLEGDTLSEARPDARLARRAQEVFAREAPKSFNIDLADVSDAPWYLVPPPGDFLSDVRTRRFGTLTYARNQNQPEDITLFNRERKRTVALYASAEKLAEHGLNYDEDELRDYDITAYDIEASIDPVHETVAGRARITLRSRVPFLATLTLRLADSLNVTSVSSVQFGRLLHLRVRNQNGILVNLPTAVTQGTEITLVISYAGHINAQRVDAESVSLAQGPDDTPIIAPEPSFLLSNRSYWYPQNSVSDYATARLRIGLPEGWGCVASGEQIKATDMSLRDLVGPVGVGRASVFVATRPIRYLSLIASRFVRVGAQAVATGGTRPQDPASNAQSAESNGVTALSVDANPRLGARGREVVTQASDVLRFYSSLMGDVPYRTMNIAVVEDELPGGHSPAYATVLNSPPPSSQSLWRNDPAAFITFPEFFLAHELAHQWWGQAVGWKNYHEQWISEGFAQYFSALYAQKVRGDGALVDMLRQFRRWAMAESEEGPVYLGYRLGHVRGDTRVFRALVYNKGAAVLHMLRRLVGDEVFFAGLRRFYNEQRYRKAGTDDFQSAMEAESGLSLERFFERWIYGSDLPHLRYTTRVAEREVVVRFEQMSTQLFDVPVTVTITLADGRTREVVVPVTEQQVERTIAVDRAVRHVQVNRDSAALGEFDAF